MFHRVVSFNYRQRLLLNCGGELAASQLSVGNKKTKIGNFAYLNISPAEI